MKKWLSKSLAEMIQRFPASAWVFEKHGIQYQEKGNMKVAEACAEKQIDEAHLLRELTYRIHHITTADESIDFDKIPLDTLCGYIQKRHHDYIRKEVPKILARLSRLTYRYHDKIPQLMLVQNTFQQISHQLVMHLYKEEHILFPAIKEIIQRRKENKNYDNTESFDLIRRAFHAHQNETDLMEDIRQLTNNYTPFPTGDSLCRSTIKRLKSFAYDLHWHEHIENNVLFPRSMKLESEMINNTQRSAARLMAE